MPIRAPPWTARAGAHPAALRRAWLRSFVQKRVPPLLRWPEVASRRAGHDDSRFPIPCGTMMIKAVRARDPAADDLFAVPFRTQQPLGVVVNRPSAWPDR